MAVEEEEEHTEEEQEIICLLVERPKLDDDAEEGHADAVEYINVLCIINNTLIFKIET